MSDHFVGSAPSGSSGLPLPVVGQALGALGGIASALLAQHTMRLRDAANENAALDALIPAFDADLTAVVQAFRSGTSAQDCIDALLAIDSNAYNYLRAQVGKPGTAWGGPSTQAIGTGNRPSYAAPCNKQCTAGCCVYLNDLRPAIFGRVTGASTSVMGLIEAIQKGGGTVVVSAVAAPPRSAYGNYSRAAYTLTVVKPPAGANLSSAVLQTSGSGASFAVSAEGSQGTGATVPVLSSLTSTSGTALIAVLGLLILVITALFGQNALRVNR